MEDIYAKANGAARYIKNQVQDLGKTCIITGSGLSSILEPYEVIHRIPFSKIPHLNQATFHKGEFLVLKSNDRIFCALNGRLHYYEGYSAQEVSFPIRILHLLGIKCLIMTNAAGGLNIDYTAGDVVLVKDHINLLPDNPLRGPNDSRFGIRFPDMSDAYHKELRKKVVDLCEEHSIRLREGVYACFQGPSLETPSEYKFLNIIGADLVGMSTVPEVIVAKHCNIKVIVLSVVTNECIPIEKIKPTTVESVIEVANKAVPRVKTIVSQLLSSTILD